MRKFISIFFNITVWSALVGLGGYALFSYFTELKNTEDSYAELALAFGVALLVLSFFPLVFFFIKRSVFSGRRPILAILTVLHDLYFTGLVINTAVQFSDGGSVISLVVSAIMAVLGISSIISVFSTLAKD